MTFYTEFNGEHTHVSFIGTSLWEILHLIKSRDLQRQNDWPIESIEFSMGCVNFHSLYWPLSHVTYNVKMIGLLSQ